MLRLRCIFVYSAVVVLLACTGENLEQGGISGPTGNDLADGVGQNNPDPTDCEGVGCVPCEELSDCVAILPDSEPCSIWACSEGWCTAESRAEGDACDDGEPCTLDESCIESEGGTLVCESASTPCDDGSECTRDLCDPESGCVYQVEEVEGCCSAHSDCDDKNDCTVDLCDMARAICANQPLEALCDDGDPCTLEDACFEGICSGSPSDGCGVFCRVGGPAGSVAECPLDLARLAETEVSPVGLSFRLEYPTDKIQLHTFLDPACIGDLCVLHSIPQGGVLMAETGHVVDLVPGQVDTWAGEIDVALSHPVTPDSPITSAYLEAQEILGGDRQLFVFRFTLTQAETDVPVLLKGIEAFGAAQTTLATKLVDHTIFTSGASCGGELCFDTNICTKDECVDEQCVYTPTTGACEDGNPCTSGSECDDQGACAGGEPVAAGQPCAEDDLCNGNGLCNGAGVCEIDEQLSVECPEEAGICLESVCNPQVGTCYQAPLLGALCDDGDECSVADECGGAGLCEGMDILCDDNVGCTLDSCVPGQGCVHEPSGVCDDGNPCTDDACELGQGCVHTSTTADCDDGNACTLADHCSNGGCTGTADPACGCDEDSDCWFLSQISLCGGSYSCVDNTCSLDVGTVVVCPPDGYGCKEGWACAPETGQCAGTEMTCDDQQLCTADSCSLTKGCQHDWIPGCAAGWNLCTMSGVAGDIIDCPLRVARKDGLVPALSGMDIKLGWDEEAVELLELMDEQCVGGSCFPYKLLSCTGASGACVSNKLQPSGHDILVAPSKKKDWTGKLSLVAYHASTPNSELMPAEVSALTGDEIQLAGDAEVMVFRFRLLKPISAAEATDVEVKMLEVNPSTGHPLLIQVNEEGVTPLFLVGKP